MQQANLSISCKTNDSNLHWDVDKSSKEVVVKQEELTVDNDTTKVRIKQEFTEENESKHVKVVKNEVLSDSEDLNQGFQGVKVLDNNQNQRSNFNFFKQWECKEVNDLNRFSNQHLLAMQNPAYQAVGPALLNAFGNPYFSPSFSSTPSIQSAFLDQSQDPCERKKFLNEVKHQSHVINEDRRLGYHNHQVSKNNLTTLNKEFNESVFRDQRSQHEFHQGKSLEMRYPYDFRSPELSYFIQHQQLANQNSMRNLYSGKYQRKWNNFALRLLQQSSISMLT